MKRLLILSCSATKRHDPGYMPAIERYDGPLWQTLRTVDPKGERAAAAFVSAKYGFQMAVWPIADYDTRMTEQLARRMIEGGNVKSWPEYKRGRMGGIHATAVIHSMTLNHQLESQPFDDVALCGGSLYLRVMRAFVAGFQEDRSHTKWGNPPYVTPGARIVEINGPIGKMRHELGEWLLTPGA